MNGNNDETKNDQWAAFNRGFFIGFMMGIIFWAVFTAEHFKHYHP